MGNGGGIPVYAVWQPDVGPLLSLGMLTASARRHRGGALAERFEIRRPEPPESFLADLATRRGPAVLLCSDYVWSVVQNLDLARRARTINPDLFVIHGGPSAPRYPGDAQEFLRSHRDAADVLVRGEGETTICELLEALGPMLPDVDLGRLGDVAGITYLVDDEVVLTADRERVADLDTLPSPYLTGEFEDVPADAWPGGASLETNRGCPYGCTFCDWGSATLSRIRKFDMERISGEVSWLVDRGIYAVQIADANFGIMARDVDIARHFADEVDRAGHHLALVFTPAKNSTKHVTKILDTLAEAEISPVMALALQSTDPDTLEAIKRSNIPIEHYIALASDLRRRGHPVQGELMFGVPGQTYESFRTDVQFLIDHEMMVRSWPTLLLPNAPMNEPSHRDRFDIRTDERGLVVSTSSFDEAARADMAKLRQVEVIVERFGVLRHVLRYLQWDHGIESTVVMDRLFRVVDAHPERYPYLTFMLAYFQRFPVAPAGWRALIEQAVQLVHDEFGIERDSAFDAVVDLQVFLMPAPGRSFPATIELAHDYLAYYRSATRDLIGSGQADRPERPLADHRPASFTVVGDPLRLCSRGLVSEGDPDEEILQGDFYLGVSYAFELESPLLRVLPVMAGRSFCEEGPELIERHLASLPLDEVEGPYGDGPDRPGRMEGVRVRLAARAVS